MYSNLIKVSILLFLFFFVVLTLSYTSQTTRLVNASETVTTLEYGDSIIQIFHYSFPATELDNYIRAMHIGKDGLLWVATRHQIFSFDGREAKNIIIPESIQLSNINEIALDTEGNIWLWRFIQARENPVLHISVYEVANEKFRSGNEVFSNYPNLFGLEFSQITVLKNSEILLNTTDGQIFLMKSPKNIKKIDLAKPSRYLGQTIEGNIIINQQVQGKKNLANN